MEQQLAWSLAGIELVSTVVVQVEVWPEAGICYQIGQIEEQLQLVSGEELPAGLVSVGPAGLVSVWEHLHQKQ